MTWDASELATNFVNLQFEVLANDGHELLPLNFVTIPPVGTNANLTISRNAVSETDLLSVWYWLLATNCNSITLTNGVVKGLGAPYTGLHLASGTSTTREGRDFLYGIMGVRRPYPEEISRARAGNYRISGTVDENYVVKQQSQP